MIVDVPVVRVVGIALPESRVGTHLQAHRNSDRVQDVERVLDGLLVGLRLRHRGFRQVDAQEPLVRIPRARHGGRRPC